MNSYLSISISIPPSISNIEYRSSSSETKFTAILLVFQRECASSGKILAVLLQRPPEFQHTDGIAVFGPEFPVIVLTDFQMTKGRLYSCATLGLGPLSDPRPRAVTSVRP